MAVPISTANVQAEVQCLNLTGRSAFTSGDRGVCRFTGGSGLIIGLSSTQR